MGPAPTLPVKPLWARFRPPPAPTGASHCLGALAHRGIGDRAPLLQMAVVLVGLRFADVGQMGTIRKTA